VNVDILQNINIIFGFTYLYKELFLNNFKTFLTILFVVISASTFLTSCMPIQQGDNQGQEQDDDDDNRHGGDDD
jgi:hypothetical protein